MIYINLPYASGFFFPAFNLPKGKLSNRVSKSLSALQKMKYTISTQGCCCHHVAREFICFNITKYIIIAKPEFQSISSTINFPVSISYMGNSLEIINVFNENGVSMMHDCDIDSPILIMPDYFDPLTYKNFRRKINVWFA